MRSVSAALARAGRADGQSGATRVNAQTTPATKQSRFLIVFTSIVRFALYACVTILLIIGCVSSVYGVFKGNGGRLGVGAEPGNRYRRLMKTMLA